MTMDPTLDDDERTEKEGRFLWLVPLAIAAGVAWFPVEVWPLAGPVAAAALFGAVLRIVSAGVDRYAKVASLAVALGLMMIAVASLEGGDIARAVTQLALVLSVTTLVFVASRSGPSTVAPSVLAAVLSALTLWALWQYFVGFSRMEAELVHLDPASRAYAVERIRSARPFASQLVPGHLGILLATALPVLVSAAGRRCRARAAWILCCLLCVVGLVLTQSPAAQGLALGVVVVAVVARSRWYVTGGLALLLSCALVAAVSWRADLARLEPLRLRSDNWRTAVWVWSTSPAAGVGFAGFAQASRDVPFEVGNHPAHVHNLPLEGLAELGPVGLGLVSLLFFAVGRLAWRLRSTDPWLGAAICVVPLHNLVDFSLLVSGVALPWAVLCGWAWARSGPDPVPMIVNRVDPARTVLTIVGSLLVGMSLLHASSRVVSWSVEPGAGPGVRLATAERAWRLAPWRFDPLLEAAEAALTLGDRDACSRAELRLAAMAWLRPGSVAADVLRARLAFARGDRLAGDAALWRPDRSRPVGRSVAVHARQRQDRRPSEDSNRAWP